MEMLEVDVELIDCGQATTRTHGLPYLLAIENGFAPFNRFWFYP